MNVGDLCDFLAGMAPPSLAEDWDNVGLLVGDRSRPLQRVMTCLTVTPSTAAEAIQRQADLIIAHHPLPFRPLKTITTETTAGRLLWELMGHRIALYSAHTAYDSARMGINAQLAAMLDLVDVRPLIPATASGYPFDPGSAVPDVGAARSAAAGQAPSCRSAGTDELGTARMGFPSQSRTLADLARHAKERLSLRTCQVVGTATQRVTQVAIACGSAGSMLETAIRLGCDAMVTGETSFHTCLEAETRSIGLLMIGHYASERFAMEWLAGEVSRQFAGLDCWPSATERDPIETW